MDTLVFPKKTWTKALCFAFPKTIPIMTGFGVLGFAYGVYMNVSGFPFWYPMIMALTIFGGSLEYVAVSMLLAPFAPLQVLLMTLLIQARHLFYGIAMLERYRGLGWKRFYLIFGLCDETFSVNYTIEIPEDKGLDRGWVLFFVTLLDQCYWVGGATLGGLMGYLIPFETEGLDFVMTAMFVVIFMEQWRKEKQHATAWVGLAATAICLSVFGPEDFLIPSMAGILVCLSVLRKPITKAGEWE